MKYYLAVDIGASSGRLILGHREEGKMILEEVHRFGNGMEMQNGHLTWDVDQLFAECGALQRRTSDTYGQ